MFFGLPALTISTRCVCMYDTTPACFWRSGVMKLPLITASHFFAFNAGISPGNAVFDAEAVPPHVFASATAMSASKPTILPLVVVYSIGGNVGSVHHLNVAVRCAEALAARTATARAGKASAMAILLMCVLLLRKPKAGAYSDWATSARSRTIVCGSIECS